MSNDLQKRLPVAFHALRMLKYAYRLGPLQGPLAWARLGLAREPVAVKAPNTGGTVLVRPGTSDVWTFEKIFISLEYDLSFLDADPEVIIDVGANVGYASVYFASRYPRARIIAVEPEAANFALLERNTARFPSVTPVHAALWPHAAKLAIGNPDGESWSFQVSEPASAAPNSVRGVSMDELLEEHGISRVDILKMDIEGAEKEVFEPGCASWLAKTRILVVELHDWFRDGCGTAFYAATSRFPFRHYNIGENVVLVRSAGT